ncbi:hypothetical protein SEA_GIBBLES_8 [Gordonia phage Gibbles]|nr:hypothetical protein SEA_GIBBLES_8 [Gordonia phage Gibbles]
MTHFPGDDYQTYVSQALTYHRKRRPSRAIIGGIKNFIDFRDFTPNYLNKTIKGWEEYVYIDTKNKTAKITYADPLSTQQAGYWNITEGTLEGFLELVDKYDKIFVHIDVQSRTFINLWHNTYAKKVRWLYEAQEKMRDTLSIIPFGTFDYEMYYCMGFAGGGRSAGMFYEREIMFPDGRTYEPNSGGSNWGVWQKYRDRYPGISNLALSFKMLKITPALNKEYYDRIGKIPLTPYVTASMLDHGDVSSMFFCHNFRDTGKKNPRAQKSVFTGAGKNRARPDQHRFITGDAVICDKCTLNYSCKLYRKGGLCIVDGSEGSELIKKFKSDKAKDIVEGMQYLLVEEVVILENELEKRKRQIADGEKPDLTPAQIAKQINSVMAHGEKVAKLKDPSLTKPKVNINMPAIPSAPQQGKVIEGEVDNRPQLETMNDRDKQALIRRMESLGYNRANITQETMQEFLIAEKSNLPQLGEATF